MKITEDYECQDCGSEFRLIFVGDSAPPKYCPSCGTELDLPEDLDDYDLDEDYD